MNQLPLDMAGLHLMEESDIPSPTSSCSSESSGDQRVLRKRTVDSTSSPATATNKRRCLQLPQKKETLAQIKKLYLNLTFKDPCQKNLETIYEECDSEKDEEKIGKQKIRRSILFRDGVVNKMKAKQRKKMIKRLDLMPGHSKPKKKVRLSLDAVLGRLSEDLDNPDTSDGLPKTIITEEQSVVDY